jgi:two-component system chemotaxis response regulator CheB
MSPERRTIVAVAGSTGGGSAMRELLAPLTADFPAPILYLQRLNASHDRVLAEVLQSNTTLPERWAQSGDRLRAGVVYVCPPAHAFAVAADRTIALVSATTRRARQCAADRLFTSVAEICGPWTLS